MNTSVRWLNDYLSTGASGLGPVTPEEADRALTNAGFPIEETTDLGSDTMLDVELTSNRGDCLSHTGLAREIAAVTGRALKLPEWADPPGSGPVGDHLTLENREPGVCPRFTARVIRGCRVGPSPAWLVERLEAVGQRSINNVVDVTNFVSLELGHPCHVFDLAKLRGHTLVIRWAKDKEKLRTLDGREHELSPDLLVVADAERATSLAGVIGGAESEVTDDTTDVVLEMATWDPVTVRRASRATGTRTDASHRFERFVAAAEIDFAARRACALIAELSGGTLCDGVLDEGAPTPDRLVIDLRPERVRRVIGVDVPETEMTRILETLEIGVEHSGGTLRCTIPPFRPDLTREIDLVEEVCRVHGFDAIPVLDRLPVRIDPPQTSERGRRELDALLAGQGFYETVTFSFVAPEIADLFMCPGLRSVSVDDERRGAEPTLRPSIVPNLLACRRANQDSGVTPDGGVRLFEVAAVYAETDKGESVEHRNIGMLIDVAGDGAKRTDDDTQHAVRRMRGAIETLVRATVAPDADLVFASGGPPMQALDPDATAGIMLDASPLGYLGVISDATLKRFGLDTPVIVAEINHDRLCDAYPPRASIEPLPEFPGIERDVSLVVDETVRWGEIESLVRAQSLERLKGADFVGAFRGKSVGAGKKSVTVRLRFRDSSRTMRHEEVDPEIDRLVAAARDTIGAELRA